MSLTKQHNGKDVLNYPANPLQINYQVVQPLTERYIIIQITKKTNETPLCISLDPDEYS